jgi:MYXO-CTERM domain-containing protein
MGIMSATPTTRSLDVPLTAVVAAAVLGSTAVLSPGRWTDPGWLALGGLCALLLWRRRRPVPVTLASMAVLGVYYPLSSLDGPAVIVYVVALYTVAATGRPVAAVLLAAAGVAGAGWGEAVSTSHPLGDVGVFMLAGWLTAVVALGTLHHGRAAHAEAVRRGAADAARAREAEVARAADEERLQLAREVHDVVGHSLALITVQAAAALHHLPPPDAEPARSTAENPARPALEAIRDTSRDALQELRSTLLSLRAPRP